MDDQRANVLLFFSKTTVYRNKVFCKGKKGKRMDSQKNRCKDVRDNISCVGVLSVYDKPLFPYGVILCFILF